MVCKSPLLIMKKKEFKMVSSSNILSDILGLEHENLIKKIDKTISKMETFGGRGIYNPKLYFRKSERQGYELSEIGCMLITSIAAPLRFRITSLNKVMPEMQDIIQSQVSDKIDEYLSNIRSQE